MAIKRFFVDEPTAINGIPLIGEAGPSGLPKPVGSPPAKKMRPDNNSAADAGYEIEPQGEKTCKSFKDGYISEISCGKKMM